MKLKSFGAIAALALLSAIPANTAMAAGDAKPKKEVVTAASAVPTPPEGKGQVVFFRRSSLMGMPYWTNVREGEALYGKLSNGVYFVQPLDPGVHTFNTSVLGKDSMRVEVDAGETYFVEGKITMALIGYTVIMQPADQATFEKVFKGMKPAKPIAPGEKAEEPAAAKPDAPAAQ